MHVDRRVVRKKKKAEEAQPKRGKIRREGSKINYLNHEERVANCRSASAQGH